MKELIADCWLLLLCVILALLLPVCFVCGTIFDCQTGHAFHRFNLFADSDSYFCPLCGDQLKNPPVLCPSCNASVPSSFDFCAYCGGSLE